MGKFCSVIIAVTSCFCFLGVSSQARVVKHRAKNIELSYPQLNTTYDPPYWGSHALYVMGHQIVIAYDHKSVVTINPFRGVSASRQESFGTFADVKEISLGHHLEKAAIVGLEILEHKLMMLDGRSLSVGLFEWPKLTFIDLKTFAWDTVRPAPDRGGEPTQLETQQLRHSFVKSWNQINNDVKIVGFAFDRGHWLGKDPLRAQFFLATRLKDFPVVTLSCDRKLLTQCYIDRACFVHGLKGSPLNRSGLAIDLKKREILILNQQTKVIDRLHFYSCFNIRHDGQYKIPPMIKQPTGIFIDSAYRLWLSSRYPDDQTNGAIYYWPLDDGK